jgi:hypothetical protein
MFRRYPPAALHLPWPLPALFAWGAAWGTFVLTWRGLHWPPLVSLVLAAGLATALALREPLRWRRHLVAWGFPLSLGASGIVGTLPAWGWLVPLVVLALVYPLRSWRDAPLFPTPRGALDGLARQLALPAQPALLDAGCGLGDGLRELRREFPHALLDGLEWSWPLRLACAWRVPFARVRRGDIWRADWSGYDLVYLFQRPESMARAGEKAQRECVAGRLRWRAWSSRVPGGTAMRVHECADGGGVWL